MYIECEEAKGTNAFGEEDQEAYLKHWRIYSCQFGEADPQQNGKLIWSVAQEKSGRIPYRYQYNKLQRMTPEMQE